MNFGPPRIPLNSQKKARADSPEAPAQQGERPTGKKRKAPSGTFPPAHTPAGLVLALERVYRQLRETDAFLQTQTEYNRAITGFALASLPSGAPVEQLVSRLVIARKPNSGA